MPICCRSTNLSRSGVYVEIDSTEAGKDQGAHETLGGTDAGFALLQISEAQLVVSVRWRIVIADYEEAVKHNRCTAANKLE